ncbi:AraC family transcriptional regulator [Rhizobium leguminosarum]|uniref:Transcriptional regulator, AraC family n=1 Tax=Rhizobium leguminosarum bv. trifolii (strain WSM1325) TaxID=395491 RepID=C6AWR6_RHILS|nr:AraC family transcriptional regulator [Rhizobium leguminosarum]ACS57963.1 transcriptional regulator, AraC family [Rhizobium leguminosarum bv. trifolii WSM1325]MBY2906858.1 AraC family transcriptional regulator [Rhizobium leguminosarum]MBY2947092.1 AraC family transcriptional regulator [Rhizobium leguminosarum]MBY2990993.1 AraC family transcriptional regulator [Rhizobium leguminosarum]MBY3056499.1 AraC family transcriptional regulator [Rhizobium leguminosarum]
MQTMLEEMRRLTAHAENRPTETGIPGILMVKGEIPEHKLGAVYEPMVNLILDGSKTLTIAGQDYYYDPASYFVISIDVPATGMVQQAGPDRPYIGVSLSLDPVKVAALLLDLPPQSYQEGQSGGYSVCRMTPELPGAWLRMLQLMERPQDIPALAPAYEREILYRVLQGPQGWMLRDIAAPDSALSRIRLAIRWVREHYAEAVEVEKLAALTAMSVSAFHRHFKAVTAMSPIQFQKRIRLLQARQLLISQSGNASSVAYSVGYESVSQFTREYARFFGQPPARDASLMRENIRPAA